MRRRTNASITVVHVRSYSRYSPETRWESEISPSKPSRRSSSADGELVRAVRVGVEQRDRDRVDALGLEDRERLARRPRGRSARGSRRRRARARRRSRAGGAGRAAPAAVPEEVVGIVAVAAPHLEHVAEAARRDQARRARRAARAARSGRPSCRAGRATCRRSARPLSAASTAHDHAALRRIGRASAACRPRPRRSRRRTTRGR